MASLGWPSLKVTIDLRKDAIPLFSSHRRIVTHLGVVPDATLRSPHP
ncbi:MAG: hypothetical protein AAGE98_20105 [Actinomycetota bacterium]